MKILFDLPAMVVVVLSWVNFSALDSRVGILKDIDITSCFLKHQQLSTAVTITTPNKLIFLLCVAYITHIQKTGKFSILLI